jgi:hypothetical protein
VIGIGNGPARVCRRPVVLRESSAVLGSLASGALSPTEARRLGQIAWVTVWRVETSHYRLPFPAGCREGCRETNRGKRARSTGSLPWSSARGAVWSRRRALTDRRRACLAGLSEFDERERSIGVREHVLETGDW